MRLLLLGTLSATLLGLLIFGGRLIATRRPGDSLHPLDAPDEPDEAPAVQRPTRSFVPLPSITADTCTPRPGWACWRGRLQLSPAARSAWAAQRTARAAAREAEDGEDRDAVATVADGAGELGAALADEDQPNAPAALPPEGRFDQFFAVRVSPIDDGEAAIDESSVQLRPDGTFEVQLPPGRYTLEAASVDQLLIGGRDDLPAIAGAAEDGVDITLAPAVKLSGRILDDDDVPVDATVTLTRVGDTSQTLTETTEGKFAFEELRPGRFRLVAQTPDGHSTEGIFRAPLDGITLRTPRPRAGLLLFPRLPDGRCLARHLVLKPHPSSSQTIADVTAVAPRRVWVSHCQAMVENVPPESTWDVVPHDLHGPAIAQIHFGSDWPLAPVCVEGSCANDAAVLEPWLMNLNGDRVDFPVTVSDDATPGAAQPQDRIGFYIAGLRANRTVTVHVDLDAGPVTQQVWLRPGVNRVLVRLPIRDLPGLGVID